MRRLQRMSESDWFCLIGWAATAILIIGGVIFVD